LLEKFNERSGMSIVIRRNDSMFELTTSNETLRDITQGYSNCLMADYLRGAFGSSVCIGWGLGMDIVSSQRNATKAFMESRRNASHYPYLVSDAGELIGPLTGVKAVTLSGVASAGVEEAGRLLGIEPANLQKLINLQERRGINLFSSADLAFYLNVTPRSASRILARLAERGYAKVVRNEQTNSKGRPHKIYDVDYRKLAHRLVETCGAERGVVL
jgi:hypothetical protein